MVRSTSVSRSAAPTGSVRLRIPAHSFRRLRSPLIDKEVGRYWAIVPLSGLPDVLHQWSDVNPRDPSVRGHVARQIQRSLQEDPEWFELYNRGLSITAEDVKFDNTSNEIHVTLKDPEVHGVVDGLHTLMNIAEVMEDWDDEEEPVPGNITIEFVTGLPEDRVTAFSSARNTSLQVHTKSLADQAHKFDSLKAALDRAHIDQGKISWHENEDGDMDVRELVSLLALFNRQRWSDTDHPVQAYYGKEVTLRYFLSHEGEFKEIHSVVGDIVRLHEWVRYHVPKQQIASGSRFHHITGIRTHLEKPVTLPFTDLEVGYTMPDAYVYPIVAGFRAMMKEAKGKYEWVNDLKPQEAVEAGLASEMFREGIFPTVQSLRNAMAVGKSPSVWGHCYIKAALYAVTHTKP